MTRKLMLVSLVLTLAILGTPRLGLAQDGGAPGSDRIATMMAEGWRPLVDGVLQRHKGGNKVETFAYGAEGMKWALQELEGKYFELADAYKAKPTRELRQAIRKIRGTMEGIRKGLENGEFTSSLEKASMSVNGCNFSFGYNADAYPLNPGPGVGATASSNFWNDCYYGGEVYAEAKSAATNSGTLTELNQFDGPRYGYSASAYASTSVGGRPYCASSAYAYVYSSVIGFFDARDSNSSCPDPPLTVTISGPISVSISGYNCRTLTWTASASGGVSPYSYSWVVNGWSAGSGNSYSETFCGDNYAWTQTVNLQVTATDAVGSTASNTHSTTIRYYRSDTCDPYATDAALPICPIEPY